MDVLQSAQEGILLLINIAVCLVNCLLKMFGCIFDDDTERNRDDVTDLLQLTRLVGRPSLHLK